VKYLKTLILFFFSLSLIANTDYENELLEIHCATLNGIELIDRGFIRDNMAIVMNLAAGGKFTDDMLTYFTNDLSAAKVFLQAYFLSEELSKEICGLDEDSKRRSDDAVDAVRHFIWSTYMTYHLGEVRAREIMSLQEDRGKSPNNPGSLMDFNNNELGIAHAKFIKSKRKHSRKNRRKYNLSKAAFKRFAMEKLKSNEFKILKKQKSKCQL